jgi:3-phenylpropionate/trans-cinnamate dioxygenase ferredoxin reductase subunit
MSGQVADLARLAPDVIGVSLEMQKPFHLLPAQYCKMQFRGFPARCYSPSYPLEGGPSANLLHFHVRRLPGGIVSSALGKRIRVGHRVRLTGPFGSAFLRPNHSGRTVLVSSGTGFAPMWSIAVAAITERPPRELVVVVATRKIQSFYMHGALCRLALFPNVTIVPIVSEPQSVSPAIRSGRPTDHLPNLSPNDVVYTSGAPAMTEHVARIAKDAGAKCYTDPFVPNAKLAEHSNLMDRLIGWLDHQRRNSPKLQPAQKPARASS